MMLLNVGSLLTTHSVDGKQLSPWWPCDCLHCIREEQWQNFLSIKLLALMFNEANK